MTGIPLGKVAFDSVLVIIVKPNPAFWRAAVMGVPKLPDAFGTVSVTDAEGVEGTTYTENGDFFNCRHNVTFIL